MKRNGFTIDMGEDLDPEEEVLRHLERQRSKLDYGDGDDDDEENIDFEFDDIEDVTPKTKASKYEDKIKELFSEEEKKPKRKVKMAKKKAKKKNVKKEVKKKVEEKKPEPTPEPVKVEETKIEEPAAVIETQPEVKVETGQAQVQQPETPPPTLTPKPEEGSFFRKFVVTVIIVLLLFLAYKYTVAPANPTGASFAEMCTSNYVTEKGGFELSMTGDAAQTFWMDKLLTTTDSDVAKDIALMFACTDKPVTMESTPDEFDDCKTQDVYVVVKEDDLKSVLDSELATCTKIDDMISCSNGYFITGEDAMKNGENPAKFVLIDEGTEEFEYDSESEEVLYVFKAGEKYYSLAMNEMSENKAIVKLFTEQGVDGFELKYRTEDPRVVAWTVN